MLNDAQIGPNDSAVVRERKSAVWNDWRRVTSFLAATLACCTDKKRPKGYTPQHRFSTEATQKLIPQRHRIGHVNEHDADRFLDRLNDMLISTSAFQREVALDSVCFDLDPCFYPDLLFKLDGYVECSGSPRL